MNRQPLIPDMLDALETPTKELTKWEQGFVESVTEQYVNRGTLTDRQIETLKSIYDEKR